jgi:nucleotide-binding universal stress UspA family protein
VARLADIDAMIDAVAVVHLGPAVAAALDAAHVVDVLEREAEAALDEAVEILGGRARKRYLNGFVTPALLDELQRFDATLIALGTHEHRRTTEIVFGGVAGEVLHRAPCSVLIARPSPAETFPHKIAVGHDGSRPAADALAVAQHLAARYESSLKVIVALAGNVVNLAPASAPFAETVDPRALTPRKRRGMLTFRRSPLEWSWAIANGLAVSVVLRALTPHGTAEHPHEEVSP